MSLPKSIENYKPANKRMIEFKPDFNDAALRCEAYWNNDIIDRPILMAAVGKRNEQFKPGSTYHDRIYGDADGILHNALHNAECVEWLGESMPSFWFSLGTHEIATFCGYEVVWAPNGGDTNWCKHSDKTLEELLPLEIDTSGYMWKRAVELIHKAGALFDGRIIPNAFDFHTNLDLLLSVRGDANLCTDTYDCPEMIDRGIENSCVLFKQMWETFVNESGCDKYGYYHNLYSEKPTTSLACDFSALIGSDMFKRWGVPALEYECSIIGDRAVYHWDGPDAIKHCGDLLGIKNIHTLAYVPSPGTYHHEFIELYKRCQKNGKGICYSGSPDDIKNAHKQLDPRRTIYNTWVSSPEEFEKLSEWFIKNT